MSFEKAAAAIAQMSLAANNELTRVAHTLISLHACRTGCPGIKPHLAEHVVAIHRNRCQCI